MSITVITGPAEEPVPLAEAKAHLRVDHDADDDLIAGYVKAARQMVEVETSRVLITQALRQTLDFFPCPGKPLPILRAPLAAVTSVVYLDGNGVSQTWAADQWTLSPGEPAVIRTAYGVPWPATRSQANAVAIEFTAGYGNAAAVPALAKQAIKLILGSWYANREDVVIGTISSELPRGAAAIIGLLKWGLYL